MQPQSGLVASQMQRLRRERGWSAEELAARMRRDAGLDWERSVVANIESRRRTNLTVEELLALAYVFGVPLTTLLIPPDARTVALVDTPGGDLPAHQALSWLAADAPLPDRADAWQSATRPLRLLRRWRGLADRVRLLLMDDQVRAALDAPIAGDRADGAVPPLAQLAGVLEVLADSTAALAEAGVGHPPFPEGVEHAASAIGVDLHAAARGDYGGEV